MRLEGLLVSEVHAECVGEALVAVEHKGGAHADVDDAREGGLERKESGLDGLDRLGTAEGRVARAVSVVGKVELGKSGQMEGNVRPVPVLEGALRLCQRGSLSLSPHPKQ